MASPFTLRRDVLSPCLGDVLSDEPGVEVGVDRHLLARHRVQGEPCGYLGDSAGALRDYDEVDDDEDGEHYEADEVVVADEHVAEGVYDLARRLGALGAVHQHDSGRGDVEREAEERRDEEHGREGREVKGALRVDGDEEHQHRERDVEGEGDVEEPRGVINFDRFSFVNAAFRSINRTPPRGNYTD